jgi:hypothetical protein
MADNKQTQIDLAKNLQLKLLKRFDKMLDECTLSATDAATLARLLMANGWSIDPAKVPSSLRGVLTDAVNAAMLEDDDADVMGPN